MPVEFTDRERAILALLQKDLPDSLTPFADIASVVGVSEESVIALIERLKKDGTIRRFGASLRHNRTDWKFNSMVAWEATEEEAEKYGPLAAKFPAISHAYFRPSSAADWPYTLYTMIHGRSSGECMATVNELLAIWPLRNYAILDTVRELKKISMTYF